MYLFNPYNNPREKCNYYLNIIDEDTGSIIFVFRHYTLLLLKFIFSNFTYISNELDYLAFQDTM